MGHSFIDIEKKIEFRDFRFIFGMGNFLPKFDVIKIPFIRNNSMALKFKLSLPSSAYIL